MGIHDASIHIFVWVKTKGVVGRKLFTTITNTFKRRYECFESHTTVDVPRAWPPWEEAIN